MDAIDLARRINDNLHWSRAGAVGPLDGEDRPLDLWAQIQALWGEPDESFASGLYLLLLGRMGDPEGMASLCRAMAAGLKRADVVRALALSEEAVMQKLDVSWLPRLGDPPRPRRFSLAFLCSAFWRLTAIRPRGFWSRIKKAVSRRST
jgi:hypothetical protein